MNLTTDESVSMLHRINQIVNKIGKTHRERNRDTSVTTTARASCQTCIALKGDGGKFQPIKMLNVLFID